MNDEIWGEDYAELDIDPDSLSEYAGRVREAARTLALGFRFFDYSYGEGVSWARAAEIPSTAFISWRDFVARMINSDLDAWVVAAKYEQIVLATHDRISNLASYAEELADGVEQTARAIEEQDVSNSESISDTMDPDFD